MGVGQGNVREIVEQEFADGCDELAVVVRDTTGCQASVVPGALARHGAAELTQVAATGARA